MSIAAFLVAGWIAKVGSAFANEALRPPHPEPRVIVNVLSVKGPHKPDRVQHDVRFGWKRIVRCYKAQNAKEKAVVTLELVVSGAGSVTRARRVVFAKKDSELAACLAGTLTGLPMPKAPADSRANVEIRLSPGDPPEKREEKSPVAISSSLDSVSASVTVVGWEGKGIYKSNIGRTAGLQRGDF